MSYVRDIRNIDPIKNPGETIYELAKKPSTMGVALAQDSKLHYHDHTHEWYFLVSGTGKVKLDDQKLDISPNNFVHIKPGTKHKAWKIGPDPISLYVVSSPEWTPEDHHVLE